MGLRTWARERKARKAAEAEVAKAATTQLIQESVISIQSSLTLLKAKWFCEQLEPKLDSALATMLQLMQMRHMDPTRPYMCHHVGCTRPTVHLRVMNYGSPVSQGSAGDLARIRMAFFVLLRRYIRTRMRLHDFTLSYETTCSMCNLPAFGETPTVCGTRDCDHYYLPSHRQYLPSTLSAMDTFGHTSRSAALDREFLHTQLQIPDKRTRLFGIHLPYYGPRYYQLQRLLASTMSPYPAIIVPPSPPPVYIGGSTAASIGLPGVNMNFSFGSGARPGPGFHHSMVGGSPSMVGASPHAMVRAPFHSMVGAPSHSMVGSPSHFMVGAPSHSTVGREHKSGESFEYRRRPSDAHNRRRRSRDMHAPYPGHGELAHHPFPDRHPETGCPRHRMVSCDCYNTLPRPNHRCVDIFYLPFPTLSDNAEVLGHCIDGNDQYDWPRNFMIIGHDFFEIANQHSILSPHKSVMGTLASYVTPIRVGGGVPGHPDALRNLDIIISR